MSSGRFSSKIILNHYFSKKQGLRAAISSVDGIGRRLLSFLDADGTCEPSFLPPVPAHGREKADVVPRCRLNANSKIAGHSPFWEYGLASLLSLTLVVPGTRYGEWNASGTPGEPAEDFSSPGRSSLYASMSARPC